MKSVTITQNDDQSFSVSVQDDESMEGEMSEAQEPQEDQTAQSLDEALQLARGHFSESEDEMNALFNSADMPMKKKRVMPNGQAEKTII